MYIKKYLSTVHGLSKFLVNSEQDISPKRKTQNTRNCGKPVKFDTSLNLELLKRYLKTSNLEPILRISNLTSDTSVRSITFPAKTTWIFVLDFVSLALFTIKINWK